MNRHRESPHAAIAENVSVITTEANVSTRLLNSQRRKWLFTATL